MSECCMENSPGVGIPCRWGGLLYTQGDGVGTRSPTWTTSVSGHGLQFDIYLVSPLYYQVPIDVTARWVVSPFDTRSPFNRWVEWSSSLKQQQHQNSHTRNHTHDLLIDALITGLQTHTHVCTHVRTHTHTH